MPPQQMPQVAPKLAKLSDYAVEVLNPREARQGGRVAFFDVSLPQLGITFLNVVLHRDKAGALTVQFPGRPLLTPERELVRDPGTGKLQYRETVKLHRDVRIAFEQRVLTELRRVRPDLFEPFPEQLAAADPDPAISTKI